MQIHNSQNLGAPHHFASFEQIYYPANEVLIALTEPVEILLQLADFLQQITTIQGRSPFASIIIPQPRYFFQR